MMFSFTVKLVASCTCDVAHEFGKLRSASRDLNPRPLRVRLLVKPIDHYGFFTAHIKKNKDSSLEQLKLV